MANVIYDRMRLREAVTLLLSRPFGESRSAKVRDAIASLPKSPKLYGKLSPLVEIINVARQDPFMALRLVDEADKKREQDKALAEKALEKGTASTEDKMRELRRQNTAKYRQRLKDAVTAREKYLGRGLTPTEKETYLDELKKAWKLAARKRVNESYGEDKRHVMREFANDLNARMHKKAQQGQS